MTGDVVPQARAGVFRRVMLHGVFAAVLIATVAGSARASCVCRCVDGEMQPLCTSSIDLPPLCPLTACALLPPSLAPLQPLQLPPLGTSQCAPHQVFNPATRQYDWTSVCQ